MVDEFSREQDEYILILNKNRDTCLCIKDEKGVVIGTSLGTFNGAWGWICRVAVKHNYQNHGYGRMLLEETEKRLKKCGASKILLSVNCTNTKVIPFYKKLGFKEKDSSVFMYKTINESITSSS